MTLEEVIVTSIVLIFIPLQLFYPALYGCQFYIGARSSIKHCILNFGNYSSSPKMANPLFPWCVGCKSHSRQKNLRKNFKLDITLCHVYRALNKYMNVYTENSYKYMNVASLQNYPNLATNISKCMFSFVFIFTHVPDLDFQNLVFLFNFDWKIPKSPNISHMLLFHNQLWLNKIEFKMGFGNHYK